MHFSATHYNINDKITDQQFKIKSQTFPFANFIFAGRKLLEEKMRYHTNIHNTVLDDNLAVSWDDETINDQSR